MGDEPRTGSLFSFIRIRSLGLLVLLYIFSVISSIPGYSNFSKESHLNTQSLGQSIELPPGLAHYIVDACSFDGQTAVDEVFFKWVEDVQQVIEEEYEEYEEVSITNNSLQENIPDLCSGGTATVRWTIELDEDTILIDATFELVSPEPIYFSFPEDCTVYYCDLHFGYYDPQEALISLRNLTQEWILNHMLSLTNSITGGCNPIVEHDFNISDLDGWDICSDQDITVTWTITDICTEEQVTATFTYIAPDVISWTEPLDKTVKACDFEDVDLAVAQANLDASIAYWVQEQTDVIVTSITGGCSPDVTFDYFDQSIDFCTGGTVTITWTINDLCEAITITAEFILEAPLSVNYGYPEDLTVDACDFDNPYREQIQAQADLDASIAAWVVHNNTLVQASGGCSVEGSNSFEPGWDFISICEGGTLTITWMVVDICFTHSNSATVTAVPPEPISFFIPENETWDASNFANQEEFESAFGEWIISINTEIESNIQGGCYPTITHNASEVSLPSLSDGGTIAVTWTIFDICEMHELIVEVQLDASTSVTELTMDDGILIYPNPAKGVLHVQLNDWTTKLSSVKIYDTLGALHNTFVLENSGSKVTLDIASLKPGSYFLEVQTGNTSIRRQFIVQ